MLGCYVGLVAEKQERGGFPVSKTMVKHVLNVLPTEPSAGVLIRRNSLSRLTLSSEVVVSAANDRAYKKFRRAWKEFQATDSGSVVEQRGLRLTNRRQLVFPGMAIGEARALWEDDLAFAFEFLRPEESDWSTDRTGCPRLHVGSAGTQEDCLDALLEQAYSWEKAGTCLLPQAETFVSSRGISVDVQGLPELFGVSSMATSAIEQYCGGVAEHLLESQCTIPEQALEPGEQQRLDDLRTHGLVFETKILPEVVLAVLEYWHSVRDDWARGYLKIPDGPTVRRWGMSVFVPTEFLFGRLFPGKRQGPNAHRDVRAALIPALSLAATWGSGSPPFKRVLDLANPPDSRLPDKKLLFLDGLKDLPEEMRRGFVICLDQTLESHFLPYFSATNGEIAWGPAAAPAAAKDPIEDYEDQDEKAELEAERRQKADTLRKRWKALNGYRRFPTSIVPALQARGFTPSSRRLLRAILANEAFSNSYNRLKSNSRKTRMWLRGDNVLVFYPSGLTERLSGEYRLAGGNTSAGMKLTTWLAHAGYSATGALPAAQLLQFLSDSARLHDLVGVDWDGQLGSGEGAIARLRLAARDVRAWGDVLWTFLLPVDFDDRLQRLADGSRGDSKDSKGFWDQWRFREGLRRKGLSQKDYADLIEVTQATVSAWATGKKDIPKARQLEMDRVLGRPPALGARTLRNSPRR